MYELDEHANWRARHRAAHLEASDLRAWRKFYNALERAGVRAGTVEYDDLVNKVRVVAQVHKAIGRNDASGS